MADAQAVYTRLAAYNQKSKDRKKTQVLPETLEEAKEASDKEQAEEQQQKQERKESIAAAKEKQQIEQDKNVVKKQRLSFKPASIPAPGSITLPLLVVLLLLFFVQQINGKSRAEWFWDVLSGQASVLPANSILSAVQINSNQNNGTQGSNPPTTTPTLPSGLGSLPAGTGSGVYSGPASYGDDE